MVQVKSQVEEMTNKFQELENLVHKAYTTWVAWGEQ